MPNALNCDAVDDGGIVAQYVAGTLPPDRTLDFEAHLFTCARCREEVRLGAARGARRRSRIRANELLLRRELARAPRSARSRRRVLADDRARPEQVFHRSTLLSRTRVAAARGRQSRAIGFGRDRRRYDRD